MSINPLTNLSTHPNIFNLTGDYNLFRNQILERNPLNPVSLNNGNKLNLSKPNNNSLDSVDRLFHDNGKQPNQPKPNQNVLDSVNVESSRLTMQRKSSVQQQANLQRVVIENGNKPEFYTKSTINTQSQSQMKSELETHTSQLANGIVNGKKVALTSEKDLKQTVVENRTADTTKNQATADIITRDSAKNGNVTKYSTRYDTTSQGDTTTLAATDRKTTTEVQARTFNQDGTLKSSQYSNQAVTTDQDVTVAQNWQGTGNRAIDQTVTVNSEKNGNQAIREVNSETMDIASANKVINTSTQATTNNLIEKFDQAGNQLSSTTNSQQATTTEARTIDSNRTTASEQNTRTVNEPGSSATVTQAQYLTKAVTVDKTDAETLVQNFNAAGELTGQKTSERETLATTTEKTAGESLIRSATTVKNGSNLATTDITARTKSDIETEILYNQDGNLTKRTIDTEITGTTNASIENRLNPNGQRIVNLASEQTATKETEDLTIGANNQGRLVETTTQSMQTVNGKLNFNPDTGQVGTNVAPGSIVIDLGANTGIRSSFKLDYGTLKFDFTAVRMTATDQTTTTGKVAPGWEDFTVNGPQTTQASGVAEEIHFKGEIVSFLDEAGNRVIELKADLTDQGTGALLVNNMQGFQMEDGKANIDINGKLTVSREAVQSGNTTTYKSNAQAELELNKVEKKEDVGVNVTTLTPLNTSDGFKAGLIADHGALRFNFGMFNMGISFVG